jgi:hypothetical protein
LAEGQHDLNDQLDEAIEASDFVGPVKERVHFAFDHLLVVIELYNYCVSFKPASFSNSLKDVCIGVVLVTWEE